MRAVGAGVHPGLVRALGGRVVQRGGGAADPQEQPELRRAGEALLPPHVGRSVPAVGAGKAALLPSFRGGEGQGGEEQQQPSPACLPVPGPGVPGWPGCPLAGLLPFVWLLFIYLLLYVILEVRLFLETSRKAAGSRGWVSSKRVRPSCCLPYVWRQRSGCVPSCYPASESVGVPAAEITTSVLEGVYTDR